MSWENNNPYQNNNQNWNSNFGGGNNDNFNKQKQLAEEKKKQEYKSHAERCMDAIVHSYAVAKRNQQTDDWHINEADQAGVIRYYKRYWCQTNC